MRKPTVFTTTVLLIGALTAIEAGLVLRSSSGEARSQDTEALASDAASTQLSQPAIGDAAAATIIPAKLTAPRSVAHGRAVRVVLASPYVGTKRPVAASRMLEAGAETAMLASKGDLARLPVRQGAGASLAGAGEGNEVSAAALGLRLASR